MIYFAWHLKKKLHFTRDPVPGRVASVWRWQQNAMADCSTERPNTNMKDPPGQCESPTELNEDSQSAKDELEPGVHRGSVSCWQEEAGEDAPR